MARVAVMVDAGYLLERGAEAVGGDTNTGRQGVILDERKAIDELTAFADTRTATTGNLLRIYWYDGARTQPTAEHIRLAELDNVKLRLGTINSIGQQKGVDSLIIADMIELARNRAVGDLVVVGGDEDLRVGVQVAQTYGVRVHLLGVDIVGEKAQSPWLTREADTNNGWTSDKVASFLRQRPRPPASTATPIVSGAHPYVRTSPVNEETPATQHGPEVLESAVREYFEALLPSDIDDIRTVWDASGSIPQPYDGRLLARTGTALGRALSVEEKREMRRVFKRLMQHQSR
jgi:hypothetical protein